MALHTVNLLPGDPACSAAGASVAAGDAVLFHGEGAWQAAAGGPALAAWIARGAALYVLESDLAACGLAGRCDPRVTVVDAAGFLVLTERHTQQRAWF